MANTKDVLITIYKTDSITEQPELVRLSGKTDDFISGYLRALNEHKKGKIYHNEIK